MSCMCFIHIPIPNVVFLFNIPPLNTPVNKYICQKEGGQLSCAGLHKWLQDIDK